MPELRAFVQRSHTDRFPSALLGLSRIRRNPLADAWRLLYILFPREYAPAEVTLARDLFVPILIPINALRRKPAPAQGLRLSEAVITAGGVCPIDEKKGRTSRLDVVSNGATPGAPR